MAIDILTLIIAIYGAGIASILGYRELRREKRRINIILEYVSWIEQTQLTIVNIGYRPITIADISADIGIKQNGEIIWDRVPRNTLFNTRIRQDAFPVTLSDGEHITLPLILFGDEHLKENLAKISVYDIEGNVYKDFKTREYDPKWGYYTQLHKE
jgi:hypothetical protein